ncbi:MAG: hypothetical protein PVI97_14270 [Candidatus Thiodiazotropha sp.]|jgi:hypothetical protein
MPLNWEGPDEDGIWYACDDVAIYIILPDENGMLTVGYHPSPGPMATWKENLKTVDEAKAATDECVLEILRIRKEHGYD